MLAHATAIADPWNSSTAKRGLAAAARAHDGDEFARLNREIHAAECVHVVVAAASLLPGRLAARLHIADALRWE